jgi:hypothetical protein
LEKEKSDTQKRIAEINAIHASMGGKVDKRKKVTLSDGT